MSRVPFGRRSRRPIERAVHGVDMPGAASESSPRGARLAPAPRAPHPLSRGFAAVVTLGLLVGVALLAPACGSTYTLPDRDTPVEVWVIAPAAAAAPYETNLLVYVGDRKAVDGPVRFAAGQTRQRVTTLHMRGGTQEVSVVMGGRAVATDKVKIEHRGWVVITVSGGEARITSEDREPGTAK